ncbi:hypothetical protein K438DRAFT_1984756 [Mycena galopus ATCC 62051]|nr:hypothetical protein K438DRAFT_1984756 [Mycena galopus ATCC 62051]
MHDFYVALSSGISDSSLNDLTMTRAESNPTISIQFPTTPLHLASPLGYDFDNDSVAELAHGWPLIITLQFSARYPTHTPRATLACLKSLSMYLFSGAPQSIFGPASPTSTINCGSFLTCDENDDEDGDELQERRQAIELHKGWKEVQAPLPDVMATARKGG